MNQFDKFQQCVVDANYDLALVHIQDMLELINYKRKISSDNITKDFLESMVHFLEYQQAEKDKFYGK